MLWKKIRWWQSSKRTDTPPETQVVKQAPQTIDPGVDSVFFNRELSDLAFIERVIEEASNQHHPLLERLTFLSISAEVLDQFYGVRVARLQREVDESYSRSSFDGLTPIGELARVNAYSDYLLATQQASWEEIRDELENEGISLPTDDDLSAEDKAYLKEYFANHIQHSLTPFILDREHPFPYIPSGGLCVVAQARTRLGRRRHLLLPLPTSLPRFHTLPGTETRIVTLERLITDHIQVLFTDMTILGCGTFQILRDNQLALAEQFDDLREMVQTGLKQRQKANVIRLLFARDMPPEAGLFVARKLGVLTEEEIDRMQADGQSVAASEAVAVDSLLGLSDAKSLIRQSLMTRYPHLVFRNYRPAVPFRVRSAKSQYFELIKQQDLLLHWPYDSFEVLENFIAQAAVDPQVTAIKQTLYRTTERSSIVDSLLRAAEGGKSVLVVIELEARDDEQSNVRLAQRLEAAGAQIVYGIVDLKVHSKMTLIVREEDTGTVLYSHFGTGNYHAGNARAYTDLSLLTSNQALGRDANKVFNYLTSESLPECEAIVVAPHDLRHRLCELIDAEVQHAREGGIGQIWAKLNSLTDPEIIQKLYEASNAGVQVDLVVRRHCRLRPGIEGLSENIRVKSIVGRYLEHSRIYCFGNGGSLPGDQALIYIASADWMERSFDERVEIMVPITSKEPHTLILHEVMQKNLDDTAQSWHLNAKGRYKRASDTGFSVQEWLMESRAPSSS